MVVPVRRKSIRDIPIPENRRRSESSIPTFPPKETPPPVSPSHNFNLNNFSREEKIISRSPRRGLWIAVGFSILILIFAALSFFNGATLSYVPKSLAISFDNDIFTARKTGENGPFYSVVKLSKDKGLVVPASGEVEVSRKSSGTIVVYNNATVEPQRLVENTRFQTPDGLVYRIAKAIVIPGKKTVSGVSQPGTIEVTVYADVAGDKYNVGLSDFTLPGLSGSSRFTTIYARSKTAMSGGFVGLEKVVSDQDEKEARANLEVALREELIAEGRAQVPEDFVLLPTLSIVTFEDLPQTEVSEEDQTTINLRGNLEGVTFRKSDLSTNLALEKTTLASGELVDIRELDSLNLAFVKDATPDLLTVDQISFSVTGNATVIWRSDEVALKSDLVGKSKRDLPAILNNYPTIISAVATVRPFWKSVFPKNSARISIKQLPVE